MPQYSFGLLLNSCKVLFRLAYDYWIPICSMQCFNNRLNHILHTKMEKGTIKFLAQHNFIEYESLPVNRRLHKETTS